MNVDVLCIGHASYDLVFSVDRQPGPDEKVFASEFLASGGGPAANAAVTVARLGARAAFAGFLSDDSYGGLHLTELVKEGVDVCLAARGAPPTPLSVILVKPDGQRSLVNYKGETIPLERNRADFSGVIAKAVLVDGHEPEISFGALEMGGISVLDAGSFHPGTEALMFRVDFLVCSEKFAGQWLGESNPEKALEKLAERSPCVVITLGERGLLWKRGTERGILPAFGIDAVDTTGAGDVFHGAFATAVAANAGWLDTLEYASAAGALACTRMGARPGIPFAGQVKSFLEARGKAVPEVLCRGKGA